MTLHAHIDWQGRDCDGRHEAGHVSAPNEGETEHDFMVKHLWFTVNMHPDEGCEGTLNVRKNDAGQVEYHWSEPTEEGFSARQVVFCEKEDCDLDEQPTQRDHTAEAAGY
jgi:hypothetical protein